MYAKNTHTKTYVHTLDGLPFTHRWPPVTLHLFPTVEGQVALCCGVLCVGSIAGCENLHHWETGTIGLKCTGVCARVYIHIYIFSLSLQLADVVVMIQNNRLCDRVLTSVLIIEFL